MSSAERIIGDYGIDSPRVVRGLGAVSVGSLLVTIVAGIVDAVTVMAGALVVAVLVSMAGLVLVRSSRVHKIRERVRLVDRLDLTGGERVLDVGCGRGLLLIEVATRLDEGGRAIGVDVWRSNKWRSNELADEIDHVFDNAAIEGVDERLDVTNADVHALPFADASFDAVVSGLALHHIEGFDSRVHALREIARVLAPEGRAVLIDRFHTRTYVDALRSCNLVDVARSRRVWRLLPPARYVIGNKPSVSAMARAKAREIERVAALPVADEPASAQPEQPDQLELHASFELADPGKEEIPESAPVVTVLGGRDGASDESEDGTSV
ncbi:MAG: methyltransferase domain-containing protein [Acidimicrobiia bacterium]